MPCRPRRLVLLELSEPAQFEADRRLRTKPDAAGIEIVAALGSAGHAPLLRETLWRNGNDLLLHAAACKHVPLVEANPLARLGNYVLATDGVARAAVEAGVGRVVLVPADKAVAPSNVIGATKRLAERVSAREGARGGRTRFGPVRSGNVFGYSGSVVQVFRQQIAARGA